MIDESKRAIPDSTLLHLIVGREADIQIAKWLGWTEIEIQEYWAEDWWGTDLVTDWFGLRPGVSEPHGEKVPIPYFTTNVDAILGVIDPKDFSSFRMALLDENRWHIRLGKTEVFGVAYVQLALAICEALRIEKGWELNKKDRKDCPKCGHRMGYAHPSKVRDDPALEDQIWRFQVCRNTHCANCQMGTGQVVVFDAMTGIKHTLVYGVEDSYFTVDGKPYQFFTTWAKAVVGKEAKDGGASN